MTEECRLCGTRVRVADAAHVMLNAPDVGVRDHYVCQTCYGESVEPLFEESDSDAGDAVESPEADEEDDGTPDHVGEDADRDGDVAAPE